MRSLQLCAEGAVRTVEKRYDQLMQWYLRNGLSLAPAKTTCIVYSNREVMPTLRCTVSGVTIPVARHIKVLGFTLDCDLSFDSHVKNAIQSANSSIYALRKVRSYFSVEEAKLVYSCMIRPKLEYCSAVLACGSLSLGRATLL